MRKDFCEVCGSELIKVPRPAEKLKYSLMFGIGSCELGSRYNSKTGMRQFGIELRCPNKRWWNCHPSYVIMDSLHDSDLPELLKIK